MHATRRFPVKKCLVAALILSVAAPAFAQGATTLQEVTTKGIVLSAGGMDVDVTYKPDGSFTALDGAVTGKWRIDGDKLCTYSNFEPTDTCVAYPAGKKSGDSFEVTSPAGTATIKIK
jgi:hypothetical protein